MGQHDPEVWEEVQRTVLGAANPTRTALRDLVLSFDDDKGLPQLTFEAACILLLETYGPEGRAIFVKRIDATEGRFYFKEHEAAKSTARRIFGW